MKSRISLIAGSLFALGVGLTLYKALVLGFPLLPGEYREVWTIESKISFTPKPDHPVQANLTLPRELAGWVILEEHFASSGFGFTIVNQTDKREARWTRQGLDRSTTLYYKMQAYRPTGPAMDDIPPGPVEKPLLEDDQTAAMERPPTASLTTSAATANSARKGLTAGAGRSILRTGSTPKRTWSASS